VWKIKHSANRSHHSGEKLAKTIRETIAPVQGLTAVFILRGFGAPVAKSAALFSVFVQPLLLLRIEVVLLGEAVGPAPRKQLAVPP